MNPLALTELWHRTRAKLLEDHPDIDPETLRDTIDGETGALDLVESLILGSEEDKAMAAGLKEHIEELDKRHARILERSRKRRAAALSLLLELGERQLRRPSFTASVVAGRPKAVITDAVCLPAKFVTYQPKPDAVAIKAALEAGETVPGAHLSNSEPSLRVLT